MKKHTIILAALALVAVLSFTGCRKPKPEDNTPAKEGLYLGIVGFNDQLYTMPLGFLNQSTKHNFVEFVDGLTMQNGTILYHAVNHGITSLSQAKIPENLINVSLVTFTDGLDQGSYVLSEGCYSSGAEYLAAVNSKITNNLVGGVNISAYSIGIRGSDVGDVAAFQQNLNMLSSDPNNVYEVNDMDDASDMFAQIARELNNQNTLYNLTLRLPAQEPNTKIRFTFDNVTDAAYSQHYIEGTYVRTNGRGQLTDVVYYGLDCMSGSVVTATSEGVNDLFTFQNLTWPNGNQNLTEFVQQWYWIDSNNAWQINSEFGSSENTETFEEHKSAMIMLVLDCSSSLGDDFIKMKTAANQFIETLSGNYSGR